jgi:hypothetical protein
MNALEVCANQVTKGHVRTLWKSRVNLQSVAKESFKTSVEGNDFFYFEIMVAQVLEESARKK